MFKYNNKIWFQFMFKPSGYFFSGMIWSILLYGVYVAGLTFLYIKYPSNIFEIPTSFHTVLGIVIGLLLVFRTNTAYDRWWEGRKQLGLLVNTTRHFSMKAISYELNEDIIGLIKCYPFTLKEHLRKGNYEANYKIIPEKYLEAYIAAEHKPNFLLLEMSRIVAAAYKNNSISGEQLIVLENEIEKLSNIHGACERIRNTPIPFGYTIHLKRILLIYLFTLPFAFIKHMDWWCTPLMMMVFFTMIGIELIGEEIEDPFGTDINDLPVDELQTKIEGNIDEIKKIY